MKTNENISVYKIQLPNGIYETRWSSNEMKILLPMTGQHLFVTTKIRVKGINLPQKVKIENGEMYLIK